MKNRKVGSTELFRGGPYTDELGIADWTGSTLKITMRDQYGSLVINAQPAVAATGSTWTYQPLAGHVANPGTYQIEITDVTKGVVYPQSGYEQLIIEPILTSTGTPPVDPTAHSITLAMLAQQTPGAVLLYDASGNAAVLADVAAGAFLMSGGVGIPPVYGLNSGNAAGRVKVPVLIDPGTSLVAAASYASPGWAADLYEEITFIFRGSSAANETPTFTLRNVAGGYSSGGSGNGALSLTDGANVSIALQSTVFTFRGTWYCKSGGARIVNLDAISPPYAIHVTGQTTTAGNGATGLDIAFPSNTTGTITLWGVPA